MMHQKPRLSRKVVFSTEYVPLSITRHDQGPVEAHSHDFVEVAIVASGTAVHRTLYGDRRICEGSVFVLRPGSWHAYHSCHDLVIYNCCFGTELLQRELAWVLDDPLVGSLFGTGPLSLDECRIVSLRLSGDDLKICLSYLDELRGLGTQDITDTRIDRIGYLLLLLGALSRNLHTTRGHGNTVRRHPKVLAAVRLLQSDLRRQWSLQDLATELGLDKSYLSRIFKENLGLPPLAFLNKTRGERAASLLLHTDRLVSEIGADVGWDDPNYFARRFRMHFGISPSLYRSRFKGTLSNGHGERLDDEYGTATSVPEPPYQYPHSR